MASNKKEYEDTDDIPETDPYQSRDYAIQIPHFKDSQKTVHIPYDVQKLKEDLESEMWNQRAAHKREAGDLWEPSILKVRACEFLGNVFDQGDRNCVTLYPFMVVTFSMEVAPLTALDIWLNECEKRIKDQIPTWIQPKDWTAAPTPIIPVYIGEMEHFYDRVFTEFQDEVFEAREKEKRGVGEETEKNCS